MSSAKLSDRTFVPDQNPDQSRARPAGRLKPPALLRISDPPSRFQRARVGKGAVRADAVRHATRSCVTRDNRLPSCGERNRDFGRLQPKPGNRAHAPIHPWRTVMNSVFRCVVRGLALSLAASGAVLSTVAAADAQSIDWAKVDGMARPSAFRSTALQNTSN